MMGTDLNATETEAERISRIRREAALIAKADADIDAGRAIEDDALERWLDALDQDEDVPLPLGRRIPIPG